MTTTTLQASSLRRRAGSLLLAACYLAGPGAQAAPALPQVVAGQASFSQQGNVFSITSTPNTIINWQSFSIGAGEITRFIQQNADSAVLNRVTGQDPTKILGALQSNGKVFLINPNGILFGQGARVDVNGLVASTLNLSDADFLAGKKRFDGGASAAPGKVRNEGSISTPAGGKVFLVAPTVENAGIVAAPNGEVVLAAGHSVQLVDSADPNLQVVVSAPADHALNLGRVIAQGGRIGIFGALVSQRGSVNADSAVLGANGKVVLKASGATRLGADSVTSARGLAGAGGEVQVLGAQVGIDGGATVDASGRLGGGAVLVGGDYQGGGTLQRAQATQVAAGASLRADATQQGQGGKLVVWSDGATTVAGSLSARGAGAGADGGLVETSGHRLDVDGIAVAAAGGRGGKNGRWLLDPYDIEVVVSGTSSGDLTKIAPATLTASGTDILLQASHDISFTDALDAGASVHAWAGHDIRVNAQVSSSSGDLDFRAGNAFTLGSGGGLKTGNYIDIAADRVSLQGSIGKLAGTQLPALSFTSSTPGRPIVLDADAPGDTALWLDATKLAKLSGDVFSLTLGNQLHTGTLTIGSDFSAATSLLLENAGGILVKGKVDLSEHPASQFAASQYGGASGLIQLSSPVTASKSILLQGDRVWIDAPVTAKAADGAVSLMTMSLDTAISVGGIGNEVGFAIGQEALANIKASRLTIAGPQGSTGGLTVAGAIDLTGNGAPGRLALDAGDGELRIQAPLAAGGIVALASTSGIFESGDGAVQASGLAVRGGGAVMLTGANRVDNFAATTVGDASLRIANAGSMSVASLDGLAGVNVGGTSLRFDVAGDLLLNADVAVNGGSDAGARLQARSLGGSGVLKAGAVALRTTGGIGSLDQPFHTQASSLTAYNQAAGSRPISIANQGALTLVSAVQDGAGNGGAVLVDSSAGMTVPAYVAGEGASRGEVRSASGDIRLSAAGSLDIFGRVASDSGNLRLQAGAGDAVTIAAGARVSSGSGSVTLAGGSARVADGSILVSSPDKLHLPGSAPQDGGQKPPADGGQKPPALDSCLATPGAAGCADLIAKEIQACSADPSGANCGKVMPRLETCQQNAATPGCGVVLAHHEIDVCLADPKQAGCGTKLPSYDACQAAPAGYGCAQVLQRHDAVAACIANPGAAGCTQTLPTLAECRLNGGVFGCAPVLARDQFASCVAHPEGAGCLENVLPKLAVCKQAPSTEGCAPVLELGFQACLSNPNDASCSGVLPSLSQCVSKSSERGCDAVLPTLAQCIGSPSLQGCSVRLPTLAACAASPASPGCEAVLPQPDFCGSHPGDPSCAVFGGNGGGAQSEGRQVAQAVQGTVQLVNSGRAGAVTPPPGESSGPDNRTADNGNARQGKASGPREPDNTGAKNEKPATKMYCN